MPYWALRKMEQVIVYIIHTSLIKNSYSFVLSFVDEKRKEKALKYVKEQDQLLSLAAGYLLKKYLSSGEVKENEAGKPYLVGGPYFNISHSGEYAVMAICLTTDVGVDIERIDEKRKTAIEFVLNKEEKEVNDIETLFKVWSNKESIIKCMSTSIGDIKKINGLPLEGNRNIDGEEYYTQSTIYDGYSLSITLKSKETFKMNIQTIRGV